MAALTPLTIVQTQHSPHLSPIDANEQRRMMMKARKMAYATETRLASHGLFDRISALFRHLAEMQARRRVYNETVRELSGLSDRDLADFGMNRSMITDVAVEAAYGRAQGK